MAKQYSMEMVDRAGQLYCCDGYTLSEVAELTGLSLKQLGRWSVQYGWAEKRLETGKALLGIRTKTILLREKLIENCISTLSAKDALAVVEMESLARKTAQDDMRKRSDLAGRNPRKIKSDEEALAALEKAYRARIGQLAARPDQLNLKGIRSLEAAGDLVRSLESMLRRKAIFGGLHEELFGSWINNQNAKSVHSRGDAESAEEKQNEA